LIFAKEGNLGPRLAEHILNKYNINSFVYIRENLTRVKSIISLTKLSREFNTIDIKDYAENLLEKYNDLFIDNYEVGYDEAEETELDGQSLEDNKVNAARLRKMNKEVLWYTYEYCNMYVEVSFKRHKGVCKIAELVDNFKQYEVIVVPSKMTKLGKMLIMMEHFYKSTLNPIKIVFVSEENSEHFMKNGGNHITNYFRKLNLETGELMIGDKLIELNTAWQFRKLKEKYSSFSSCSEIIGKLSTINSDRLDTFKYNGNKDIKQIMLETTNQDHDLIDEIFLYLDSLSEFQKVVETKDSEAIATKALELFGTEKIHNIYGYDKEYIDSVDAEFKRLSPIGPIINSIEYYSDECTPLLNLLLKTIHKNN